MTSLFYVFMENKIYNGTSLTWHAFPRQCVPESRMNNRKQRNSCSHLLSDVSPNVITMSDDIVLNCSYGLLPIMCIIVSNYDDAYFINWICLCLSLSGDAQSGMEYALYSLA